ncbi:hypothetical protein QQS21_000705 [Conoideocrella luteorostrata]|uniref:Alcohol dehydrogenase-like N-terminal domain-containing protein n=1 Tax=Conoideocrella luteorostrata TaxID=1105319 RepID=A0AAJ0D0J9_9HYPO|nr:hypothetical protein QQS21_000705 [Conoideocrella luteorostrata]
MTPPKNRAAWNLANKVRPFKVADPPYTPPSSGQVVVKYTAPAINPLDRAMQLIGPVLARYLKYPFVLGCDVADEVVEVGPGVKRFRVGDCALESATGQAKEIPAATAVLGQSGKPRTVIVAGGASSVGSNAVQPAASAGYRVLSTSSPKSFSYIKGLGLGAAHVFDYDSKTLVKDLLGALKGFELVGAYTIVHGAVRACTAVMKKHYPKLTRKRIAVAGSILPGDKLQSFVGKGTHLMIIVGDIIKSTRTRLATGIDAKFILLDGLLTVRASWLASTWTFFHKH